jgi:hypothetical protein
MKIMIMEATKFEWKLGFTHAINLDACHPRSGLFSKEAYMAGYGYGMDWIILQQSNTRTFVNITLYPEKYDWGYQRCLNET